LLLKKKRPTEKEGRRFGAKPIIGANQNTRMMDNILQILGTYKRG